MWYLKIYKVLKIVKRFLFFKRVIYLPEACSTGASSGWMFTTLTTVDFKSLVTPEGVVVSGLNGFLTTFVRTRFRVFRSASTSSSSRPWVFPDLVRLLKKVARLGLLRASFSLSRTTLDGSRDSKAVWALVSTSPVDSSVDGRDVVGDVLLGVFGLVARNGFFAFTMSSKSFPEVVEMTETRFWFSASTEAGS